MKAHVKKRSREVLVLCASAVHGPIAFDKSRKGRYRKMYPKIEVMERDAAHCKG